MELEKQKSVYETQLADQKAELDKAVEIMKQEFEEAQETMVSERAEALAKMEVSCIMLCVHRIRYDILYVK